MDENNSSSRSSGGGTTTATTLSRCKVFVRVTCFLSLSLASTYARLLVYSA